MPSKNIDSLVRDEWRDLGFFYELDESSRTWIFVGSKGGLLKMCDILRAYVDQPSNRQISEHEHYGPYGYLEIMTWHSAGIDDHSIHGEICDLLRPSDLIGQKLESASAGSAFEIGKEYSEGTQFKLRFEVKAEGFDPASVDPYLST